MTVAVSDFPREYKFTIGQKLQDEVIGIVVLIYKANSSATERAEHVKTLLERIQVVELLIRLSQDMRILSKKNYAALIEMTQSLSKQSEGWRRSLTKNSAK